MATETDPTTVRVVAVTVEDLVTALELNKTTGQHAVLRVTPPFSGRMRARLHRVASEDTVAGDDTAQNTEDEDEPIHIDPESLLTSDAPSYPRPAETEDELRTDPAENYTVERHHERHQDAVAAWRKASADAIDSRATLQTAAGAHQVDVTALGDLPTQSSEKL
jgi:hypothetical protein